MTDTVPGLRIDDARYSPRMLRIIANAERLGCHVVWHRGVGFGYVKPYYTPSTPHVRFAVDGNRLRLLPQKAPQS